MRYRKKPITIEAYQVTELDYDGFIMFKCFCNTPEWLQQAIKEDKLFIRGNLIFLDTLEGHMRLSINDYIVRGVDGELYPCKASIFEKTYERVE